MDSYPLERFLDAQACHYEDALTELRQGRKRTHWMWYVFPQLRALGRSRTALYFGIADRTEAVAYLAHPVLSARLREGLAVILSLDETDPVRIFGGIDARKLNSSMTLFAAVSEDNELFVRVLEKFYGGERDAATLALLGL